MYTRIVHIFGGAYSKQEQSKTDHVLHREKALVVTRMPSGADDELLFHRLAHIVEAIHLESPDQPLTWKYFY